MSTNSFIGIQNEDGSVESIYCHYDGYPSHNGKILNEYYTTEETVRELISYGELSVLAKNICPNDETPHSFENPQDDVCVFYGRDRKSKNTESRMSGSEKGFIQKAKSAGAEYAYLFDGEWITFKL